jgi:hypothetical protein
MEKKQLEADASTRREFMKKAGALAAYTPPVVVALMSPSRKALAASGGRIRTQNPGRRIHVEHEFGPKGNNGLGQRFDDPQPPGLENKPELWNDRPSSVPGQPNNKK